MDNVTSCYLIDLCHLCGTDPVRGICYPQYNVSKCQCFAEENGSPRDYTGEFCERYNTTSVISPSVASNWLPIIVGTIGGVTALLLLIAISLCVVYLRAKNPGNFDMGVRRLWHLPRAKIPTSGTNPNESFSLNNTISTISSRPTDSNDTIDSDFFKDLDKKMGENLRATITRPNTQSIIASLPSDTLSTFSNAYDPIDELDSIIDNEDIDLSFHDPLNDLFEDEILEIQNPNLRF